MVHHGSIGGYGSAAGLSGQGQLRTADEPSSPSLSTRRVATSLEREWLLISDAVAVVAAGGARRVIVAGIRFGDLLLPTARRLAGERGVQVRPVPRADGSGSDLVLERRAVSQPRR